MTGRLLGLDHVQLAMPAGEESKAREFYGQLLGIPEKSKPPHLARRGGVWFENAVIKIHLGVDPVFQPARKAHVAFIVTGVRDIAQRCRKAGYEVVDDEPLEGYDRLYVYDPFGNRLELMEPASR